MGKAIIIIAVVVSGCSASGGTFCDIARPVRISHVAIDAMSDSDVKVLLAHNEKGRALCGWKP